MTDEAILALAVPYLAQRDQVTPTIRGAENILALVRVCLAADRAAREAEEKQP